jgi:uncharacterized protein with GYD domain
MPTYISLVSWTDQGIRNVKEAPQRLDAFKKEVEDAGGKMIAFYLTMGKYDGILIVELPNDEAASILVLAGGSQGNVRTATLRAYPEDQFRNIIAKIK